MKRILALSVLMLLSFSVSAQKVGLVLSGGGAKGLYHVGIIKALEENNIPIDYVSGASMGAIVGALYASGWSPDRMWNFFLTDSVSTWLTGKIPDQYRYYYRQFDPTPEMLNVKINTDTLSGKVLQLPTNLISPYLIDLAMIDMLAPSSVAAGHNFDSLMVPFRCVASDMSSRKTIVFRNGSLPYAVRSSMTIPMVFKPLTYQDSILLFDGGVLNNFPYQTVKEDFAPDIIIGGICTGNSKNPSVDNVVGQISMLITERTDYTLPDSVDITIRRLFPNLNMLDYSKAGQIMQAGYDDAMAQMPEILNRIHRCAPIAKVEARRAEFNNKKTPVILDDIVIEGLNPVQTAYVRRQLGLHLHEYVSYEYFYEKYLKMLSAGVFTGEFPTMEFNPDNNTYTLRVRLKTEPSLTFALGGNISSNALNQGYAGIFYQRVSRNVANYGLKGYFGTYYNSVQLGARHDMYTNFPFYADYGFVYETFNHNTSNSVPYYRNKNWRLLMQENLYVTSSIAIPVLENAAFRGRLSLGNSTFEYFQYLHTSADEPSRSTLGYGNISVEIETNSMNYPLYENLGVREYLSFGFTGGFENYTPGTLEGIATQNNHIWRKWFIGRYMREQYFKIGKWFTMGYLVDLTISTHENFHNQLITSITAPRFAPTPHTSTLFMEDFTSQGYLGLGVMPVFNFLKDRTLYLKTYVFAFAPKELLFVNDRLEAPTFERFRQTVKYIFGGSLVYQTPIGPASLTLAKYTTGPKNWNIVFNFGYTLFKSRNF